MAQPANVGCENPECIAKDGTAAYVKSFGGSAVKKCGNFIQK